MPIGIRANVKTGWIVAWLLSLPAMAMAQQIAVGSGYPVPTALSGPWEITGGTDGALWFTEVYGNKIGRITTAGVINEYPTPTSNSEPGGITAGPDGALWFTELEANQIGRINTTGDVTEYPVPTANSGPYGITAGPDGALWFTEAVGQIGRITTAGVITEYPVPTANSGPEEITPGPDGALWFTETAGSQIGRITTAGVITEYPVPTANSGPIGITAGPDGALWFTEFDGNQIGRITTAGVFTEYPVPTANSGLGGITAGLDGALWFTEGGANQIGRITTAGVVTEYPVPVANGYPERIAAGPDGEMWFTVSGNANRIGEVFFVTATLGVSSDSGSYPASLSFTGSGFAPNESVQIYRSGVGSTVLVGATADSSGSFTAEAHVPQSPYGPRLFVGVGQSSGKLGAANFSILPRLILQPTSVMVGGTVTAQGTGFGPLEQVKIYGITWRTPLGTAVANLNGTFSGNAAVTFTIPPGAPSGVNKVGAKGEASGAKAVASFTVQ